VHQILMLIWEMAVVLKVHMALSKREPESLILIAVIVQTTIQLTDLKIWRRSNITSPVN